MQPRQPHGGDAVLRLPLCRSSRCRTASTALTRQLLLLLPWDAAAATAATSGWDNRSINHIGPSRSRVSDGCSRQHIGLNL